MRRPASSLFEQAAQYPAHPPPAELARHLAADARRRRARRGLDHLFRHARLRRFARRRLFQPYALAFLGRPSLRLFLGGDRRLLVGLILRLPFARRGLRLLGLGRPPFPTPPAVDRTDILARDQRARLGDPELERKRVREG